MLSVSDEAAQHSASPSTGWSGSSSTIPVRIDNSIVSFSTLLLRDLCKCSCCVHESTRQKLYSTADIPAQIRAREFNQDLAGHKALRIAWEDDVPGFGPKHVTHLDIGTLRHLSETGASPGPFQTSAGRQILWKADSAVIADTEMSRYMTSDEALYGVISQLRTYGLAFITKIPHGKENALAEIATRMGPMKDTFYGLTWDVRTVPSAINAAFTSNDLGFHTDLLYFQNPPHVQLLHCLQSSLSGGESIFTDAFKTASDLLDMDEEAFNTLASIPVNYQYEHPDSNLYHTTKTVFELRPLKTGDSSFSTVRAYLDACAAERQKFGFPDVTLSDCLEKINWGPPFLAPFSLQEQSAQAPISKKDPVHSLNEKMAKWHAAAQKFSGLLHRPEALYERLLKPGECVIFDNTRVLHARRNFSTSDDGTSRWLKGGYVDKDPYLSKLRVLRQQYERPHAYVA